MPKKSQVVDAGNTRIKLGKFIDGELRELHTFNRTELNQLEKLIDAENPVIVSNVGAPIEFLRIKSDLIHLNSKLELPIRLAYKSKGSLGVDRIANCCAAHSVYPNSNCLIIDIGSCITYDLLTNEGEFVGGAISPGINFRFRAMNNFTSHLPLVTFDGSPELIGIDTEECLKSGVFHGVTSELNGMVEAYQKKFIDLKIILTGGDHTHFEKGLKYPIFANPNLTLIGLNEILLYHSR